MGTTLLGATAGVVGSYAVLRRRALVSDMLAHAALPGICLAFLLVGARDIFALSIGALATGLVGLLLVTVLCRWTRTKEDAAIGIVLSTFFGAGVVLLSFAQRHHQGNQAGLDTYLFGEIAAMQSREIRLLLAVGTLVLLAVFALHKEFKVLAFDPDFAASQGWPIFILDFSTMALLAVVTVVGLPICGVILMAALIILPSAAARFWTNQLGSLLLLAGLFGGASAAVGTFARFTGSTATPGFQSPGLWLASKSSPSGAADCTNYLELACRFTGRCPTAWHCRMFGRRISAPCPYLPRAPPSVTL